MLILGIETSCDETAVALVEDGKKVFSDAVSSSLKFHKKYGGVIPEIASRLHLESIGFVLEDALKMAGMKLKDIVAVAVTREPGLTGSLLVGLSFARAVALAMAVPLIEINHLHAHLYAAFLERAREEKIPFPFIGLVVSGGHTSLFYVKNFSNIRLLGATLDDACGEAFDKVAKILGMGYPGGPLIERMAKKGEAQKVKFNRIRTKNPLDFSFSGIKTAVLYYINGRGVNLSNQESVSRLPIALVQDVAFAFQEVAFDSLIEKAELACRLNGVRRLVIGGGVASNNRLREKFSECAEKRSLKLFFSPKRFCTDNAAMVAGLGYCFFNKSKKRGKR